MQRILLLVWLGLLLSACDSSNTDVGEPFLFGCEIPQQNMYVHSLLKDAYLWYDEVPNEVDYRAFSSPSQILDFLRDPIDRFSVITDARQFNELLGQGRFTGYGFSLLIENDSSARLRFVYTNSAAGRAGLQRGDEFISLNGESVTDIIASDGWDRVLGPDEAGFELDAVVRRSNGDTFSATLIKDTVNINTVLHSGIVAGQEVPTGYLVFNSFLATSPAELSQVFADFHAAGVTRLVLDLRYNGGGSVPVASVLASYLNRVNDNNQLFSRLTFNNKKQHLNEDYFLLPLQSALTLDQLVVIITGETCSASEMIVNGLKPYAAEVTTVGSATCGKPVGMSSFEVCDKLLLPVMFETRNRDGEGDFYDGISANCAATDSLSFEFGDPAEPMLAGALFFANNRQCSLATRAARPFDTRLTYPANSLRAIIGAY